VITETVITATLLRLMRNYDLSLLSFGTTVFLEN